MNNVYIKNYWAKHNVLFYLHFQEGWAVRQIEIWSTGKLFLSEDNPICNNSMLYDQSFDELDLTDVDYITEDEFNALWSSKD